MKEITTQEQLDDLMNQDTPVVLMYTASWCPDCIYLKDKLPTIEENNPDLIFAKMDRDLWIDKAVEDDILGIPSFVSYSKGKETGRFVSKLRKSPEEIQAYLDEVKEKLNGQL